MRLTLTVRSPEGRITTFVYEFEGEHVAERMLVAMTTHVEQWVIKYKYELVVLTVTTSVPDVARGD